MKGRAAWRVRPDDPRTALGWFLADVSTRRLSWPFATFLMALIGALAVGVSPWTLLLIPAVALHVRDGGPAPDVSALVTAPPPGPSFAARVEIWREDAMFGEDAGIVTFVEGWLHFVGRRTEFSLTRAGTKRTDNRTLVFGEEALVFEPQGAVGPGGLEPGAGGFERAMGVWLYATPAPAGEPILPPCEVHPSGLARAWRGFVAPYTVLAPAVVLMAIFLSSWFVVVFGGFGSGDALWRLLRLRRRAKGRTGGFRPLARRFRALGRRNR